jgi:hypothetical protein
MKKIDMIRAELANDINRSATLIAELVDCQPQYVNLIRRKIKAEIANPKAPKKRKSPKAVGIASLYLPKPDKKKNFYNPEQYYLIGSVAIICIFACVIWLAMQ